MCPTPNGSVKELEKFPNLETPPVSPSFTVDEISYAGLNSLDHCMWRASDPSLFLSVPTVSSIADTTTLSRQAQTTTMAIQVETANATLDTMGDPLSCLDAREDAVAGA